MPSRYNPKKEYIRLILVLLVLFVILGSFLLYVSFPLLGTKTAVLATQPVDPFDLVRGQYITIGYEVSSVPKIPDANVGENVYVILKKDNEGISRYQDVSLKKPKEGIFIRGKIKSVSEENMRVEYGTEQYFFERNAKFNTRNMLVEVRLSDFGGARIVQLLDENQKPLDFEYKNKTLTS